VRVFSTYLQMCSRRRTSAGRARRMDRQRLAGAFLRVVAARDGGGPDERPPALSARARTNKRSRLVAPEHAAPTACVTCTTLNQNDCAAQPTTRRPPLRSTRYPNRAGLARGDPDRGENSVDSSATFRRWRGTRAASSTHSDRRQPALRVPEADELGILTVKAESFIERPGLIPRLRPAKGPSTEPLTHFFLFRLHSIVERPRFRNSRTTRKNC